MAVWKTELPFASAVIPAEFPEGASAGFELHVDPGLEIDHGRCLEGIAELGTMLIEIDLLGPVIAIVEQIFRGLDDAIG